MKVLTAAEMQWDHWTTLRGRRAHVYSFRVRAVNSRYTMVAGNRNERHSIVAGQHGRPETRRSKDERLAPFQPREAFETLEESGHPGIRRIFLIFRLSRPLRRG